MPRAVKNKQAHASRSPGVYRNIDGYREEDGRYAAFMADISAFIPQQRQFTDAVRTFAYGTDASFYRLNPKLVVKARPHLATAWVPLGKTQGLVCSVALPAGTGQLCGAGASCVAQACASPMFIVLVLVTPGGAHTLLLRLARQALLKSYTWTRKGGHATQ